MVGNMTQIGSEITFEEAIAATNGPSAARQAEGVARNTSRISRARAAVRCVSLSSGRMARNDNQTRAASPGSGRTTE